MTTSKPKPKSKSKVSKKLIKRVAARYLNKRTSSVKRELRYDVKSNKFGIKIKLFLDDSSLRKDIGYDPTGVPVQWDKNQVGIISATNERLDFLEDSCTEPVRELEKDVGKRLSIFKMKNIHLHEGIQGLGIAPELYIKIAKEAFKYDGVLVPAHCMKGGRSSPETDKIWSSPKMKSELTVIDNKIFWAG